MAKKKKGPSGKKGGGLYKGPGNFASTSATSGQKNTAQGSYAGSRRRPQPSHNRSNDIDMNGDLREPSAMMQQARNTKNSKSHWDQSSRLRDQPIIFISAGFIEPAKQLQSIAKPQPDGAAKDEAEPVTSTSILPSNDSDATNVPVLDEPVQVAQNPVTVQDVEDEDVEAVEAETLQVEAIQVEAAKTPQVSDTPDAPDVDVHDVEAVQAVEVVEASKVVEDADVQSVQEADEEDLQNQFFEDVQGQDAQDVQETLDDVGAASDSSDEVIVFKGRGTAKPAAARPVLARVPSVPEQAMRNIHLEDTPRPTSLQSAIPAVVVSTMPEPTPATSAPGSPDPNRLAHLIIDSDDDGGSDAVMDDYLDNMETDELTGMLQYLSSNLRTNRRTLGGTHNDIVVDDSGSSEDGDDDDDEEDEEAHIRRDAEKNGIEGDSSDSSDSSGDDAEDNWPLAEDINDEEFARLLAKQEEFGLGTDELVLFDEAVGSSKKSKKTAGDAKKKRKQSKAAPWKELLNGSIRGPSGSFQSAEAVADAFDQLELMGKQGKFELELSDSELEMTLQTAWQKDRARKKDKKKAREELRAQGLLGKFGNPEDTRVKYASGMEFEDVKTEFQLFLMGHEQTVALPPMDANARKIIHEIAHRFSINSKSIGSGDQRRPSLVRKKGTLRYNEAHFNSVFGKYRRRFFPRLDSKRGGPGPSKGAAGRDSGGTAAQVRNGEVVGGSAPEIGTTNKGRAMLEKMGWSMGMALGAIDNKGMTQPIEHVVKRSKAGLG